MANRDLHDWRHFYRKALTETDAQELQNGIAQAEYAVCLRLSRQDRSEQDELRTALCHLRLIRSVSACFVTEWAEQSVDCESAQRGA